MYEPSTATTSSKSNSTTGLLTTPAVQLQWHQWKGRKCSLPSKAPDIDRRHPRNETDEQSKTPDFGSRYNFIRQDRPNNKPGGGLAFIIHESIEFRIISQDSDEVLETQGIKVKVGNLELKIFNFHLPPKSSCPPDYQETLKSLLSHNNALLLEDANAHDPTWFSTIADTRGSKLSAEIEESEMGILNENCPTRLPSNQQPTSPDISLVKKSLLTSCDWSTEIGLRSDHLPILIHFILIIPGTHPRPQAHFHQHRQIWLACFSVRDRKCAQKPAWTNGCIPMWSCTAESHKHSIETPHSIRQTQGGDSSALRWSQRMDDRKRRAKSPWTRLAKNCGAK